MPVDNNQKVLDEIKNVRNEIINVLSKEICKKIEAVEKTIYLGNGKPGLITRMSSLESSVENLNSKVDDILKHASIIPIIRVEVENLQDWQRNEQETKRGIKIEKWGGIYQAIGAVITTVVGISVGAFFVSPSNSEIEKAVKEAMSKIQPVEVISIEKR